MHVLAFKMKAGRGKYHNKPPALTWLSDRVAPNLSGVAAQCLGASLSTASWLQLASVSRKLASTARKWNLDLSFPLDNDKVLNAVLAWIKEGLRCSTIRNYMGRMSTLQSLGGHPPLGKDLLLKRVLGGWENTQPESAKRLAVTPAVLWKIHEELKRIRWTLQKKACFWLVCTVMFAGALRSCEILPSGVAEFRSDQTLMPQDITVITESLNGCPITFLKLKVKFSATPSYFETFDI